MIKVNGEPLAKRLARRIVGIQLLTLIVFFGGVLFPIVVLPIILDVRDHYPLDPRVIGVFERAIGHGDGGKLQLNETRELVDLKSNNPGLWFIVQADNGETLAFGEPPDDLWRLRSSLGQIASMNIALTPQDPEATSDTRDFTLVRTLNTADGPVRVATGGGPHLNPTLILQWGWIGLATTTLLVLAIVSRIVVPKLIRRDLRGVETAALATEQLDIERRGTRLPEEGLPAEIQVLVHGINRAMERLDEAFMRRERFLADAAHELRTPIAVLQTRIETAEPFPQQQRMLDDVRRLGELANQLLDIQRFSLAQPNLHKLDLVNLAADVVADLAPLAIARGYQLELDAPENAVSINGDATSLARGISNLVRNAVTYGGEKGIILVQVKDGPATLAVSDQGPGIPESEHSRIFEPFYRLTPSSDGAGLGLSLVESVMKSHGGQLSVHRSDHGGARFLMTFPAD